MSSAAPTRLSTTELLIELEPTVASNLDRHLRAAKEWMPQDYVPWNEARDFAGEQGVAWAPEQSRLSGVAQASFEVNLLTEDNLPSYHREISNSFGNDGAWGTWVNRWTAEEGRHALVMRDYLLASRGVDPVSLERNRMETVQNAYYADEKDTLRSLAYVSFQELATRIAHRNTGHYSQDPVADRLLARVATDENLHMVFYRDLMRAALEISPNQAMTSITNEVVQFQMPGTGVPGFARKALQIADAGIYDLRIHHDEILQPVLRHWKVFDIEGLDSDGEQARERLVAHLETLDAQATRYEERRAAKRARAAAQGTPQQAMPPRGDEAERESPAGVTS